MDKKLYTKKETANLIGVSPQTLWNWEQRGLIDKPKKIGKRVYYNQDAIDKIIK